jgi:hypothetical protein
MIVARVLYTDSPSMNVTIHSFPCYYNSHVDSNIEEATSMFKTISGHTEMIAVAELSATHKASIARSD